MNFPTPRRCSVIRPLQLALEHEWSMSTLTSLLGGKADRAKRERARELISLTGLDGYIDDAIADLSTGTHRITELAGVTALKPTLLLLDEPSSGVARRETEQPGERSRRSRRIWMRGSSCIEHDMPLVMGVCDRIIARDTGRIIAEGPPQEVIATPPVLDSFVGGSSISIERCRSRAPMRLDVVPCGATTRSGSPCSRTATRDGYCGPPATTLIGTR